MSTYPPVRDELARLLSRPRLDQYRLAVGGDLDDALRLYAWNLQVSGAFFESIHYLEVALRNVMDDTLTNWATGTLRAADPWYRSPAVALNPSSRKVVTTAINHATDGGRAELPGRVVAELGLGFLMVPARQRLQPHSLAALPAPRLLRRPTGSPARRCRPPSATAQPDRQSRARPQPGSGRRLHPNPRHRRTHQLSAGLVDRHDQSRPCSAGYQADDSVEVTGGDRASRPVSRSGCRPPQARSAQPPPAPTTAQCRHPTIPPWALHRRSRVVRAPSTSGTVSARARRRPRAPVATRTSAGSSPVRSSTTRTSRPATRSPARRVAVLPGRVAVVSEE